LLARQIKSWRWGCWSSFGKLRKLRIENSE